MKKRNQGFTLVEIMIVVAIIGLLAAIAIPSFVKSRNESRKSACINNLRQIDSAKEQMAMAKNLGNASTVAWDDHADDNNLEDYIRGNEPICPAGTASYVFGNIETPPECPNVTDWPAHVL